MIDLTAQNRIEDGVGLLAFSQADVAKCAQVVAILRAPGLDIVFENFNFRHRYGEEIILQPGRESTSTGEWMRLIENGGYQHIM